MQETEDLDRDVQDEEAKPLSRKKLLVFVLPVVIVIGLSAGIFFVFNSNYNARNVGSYSVVKKAANAGRPSDQIIVFYDLPEITSNLKIAEGEENRFLRIRLNLELSNTEDAKTIEALTPKITDAVISHTIELTPAEVSGSEGLYWLRKELLYRINLITDPVKISGLNFRVFEIDTADKDK